MGTVRAVVIDIDLTPAAATTDINFGAQPMVFEPVLPSLVWRVDD